MEKEHKKMATQLKDLLQPIQDKTDEKSPKAIKKRSRAELHI